MKKIKPIIFTLLLLFSIIIFPFLAYYLWLPTGLKTQENLLTLVGLLLAYFTLFATIGIAAFIYYLQKKDIERDEKRRTAQAASAILLELENAFRICFFMTEDSQDFYSCKSIKDVFRENSSELRKYLTTEEFHHLTILVNAIDSYINYDEDSQVLSPFLRDWLQNLFLSHYRKYFSLATDYLILFDRKTYQLINKLKGSKDKYQDLNIITDKNGVPLFESTDGYLKVYSGKECLLDGKLGFDELNDEAIIIEGYGKSDEYDGYYKDGLYHGDGIQFDKNHNPLNEGKWEQGNLITGIERNWLIKTTSGKLIFKPDCPEDPYDSTDDFGYSILEQYGSKPFYRFNLSLSNIMDHDISSFYVVDRKVDNNMEELTNIRTLTEFLEEVNPESLKTL